MSEKYAEPLLSKEEYFSRWNQEELKHLKPHHLEAIYAEYKTKHIVFNRDNFTCQVVGCKFKESPPTLHHYKHASNGGKTSPRNCITVCYAHQKMYHSGRMALKFPDREELPNHISGSVQAHEWYVNGKPKKRYVPKADKRRKKELRELRKEHKEDWGRRLSWTEICLLMAFLFSNRWGAG